MRNKFDSFEVRLRRVATREPGILSVVQSDFGFRGDNTAHCAQVVPVPEMTFSSVN